MTTSYTNARCCSCLIGSLVESVLTLIPNGVHIECLTCGKVTERRHQVEGSEITSPYLHAWNRIKR